QRRRGADHGDDVGVVLHVVAQDGADDLRLVPEALGKQRPDRPVDEARRQRLLLARPRLALEEAARDLPGSEGLFLVVHRQREEVDALAGGFLGSRRAQDDGLAIGGEHGAIRLSGDASGLEGELSPTPVYFPTRYLEHAVVSFRTRAGDTPSAWPHLQSRPASTMELWIRLCADGRPMP